MALAALLNGLLLAAAAALAVAWTFDWLAPADSAAARAMYLVAALTVACGAAAWRYRQARGLRLALQQYLAWLTRCEPFEFAADDADQALAPPPVTGYWRTMLDGVHACLRSFALRLHEVEQGRARAEVRSRRLATEVERLNQVLANLSDPVLAVDRFDELVLSNRSADELFGIAPHGAAERALAHLVHCEQLVELLTETRRHKSGSQRSAEIELPDAAGQSHWYRVTCRTMTEGGPAEEAGAVAVLQNIDGQKAVQRRNAEFVAAVSHEMKTPLTGIKAYVELLADGDDQDEAARDEFLHVINTQADRLQRLIDNLLNLARIEAGVVAVHKQQLSLNELLEEALHVVQPAAEQKQIVLQGELSPLYLGVLADRDTLLQAAINLLSNAIKYTAPGGRVTLRSRLVDRDIVIEVEDTGVGLGPEDRLRVFEKFYRVKKDQQMAAGTGLGLPLAKHIVEDVHGGLLTVDSELGVGSTFRVTLPDQAKLGG